MPLKRKSPVQQCNHDDEHNPANSNDSNIRQSEHGIQIVCGMLTYNTIEIIAWVYRTTNPAHNLI